MFYRRRFAWKVTGLTTLSCQEKLLAVAKKIEGVGEEREKLLAYLRNRLELKEEELHEFVQLWHPQARKRMNWLSEPDKREQYFYFVLEGVQRLMFVNDAGREFTLGFSYTGELSGLYHSFLFDKPTEVGVQCLTPSRFLAIHRDAWLDCCDRWAAMERWGHRFMTGILMGRIEREIELLNSTAQQRLDRFNTRSSQLFLNIPHKYIAAYLGMSAETLSRLRSV